MNGTERWINIHEGIMHTKSIEKKVELLLLRELFYQFKEINSNLKEIKESIEKKQG